jgi:glycine/D-amino acid oxidase-like deaminating enzyme
MLSYWERESFTRHQYIIIGSGIVGLSTAASLIEHDSQADILILERGIFPAGASTRNAGFACFGSLTEMIADLRTVNPDDLLALVERRWNGLARLRYRLGDEQIGYLNHGGYELLFEDEPDCLNQLNEINEWLYPLFQKQVFYNQPDLVEKFGFNQSQIKTVIANPFEGQINTGKMMDSLIRYVTAKGVKIITGAEVTDFQEDEKGVKIRVLNPLGDTFSFEASQMAICTNAFTKKLMPNLDVVPGRGQVLITKPVEGLPFKGVFHYDEGFFYFRNVGNRVLIGGGRNKAFEEETNDRFELNVYLQELLRQHLEEFILPGKPFEIDMQWSGIMAFGSERKPILERASDRISVGVRMNGMGIAIGSMIGEELAGMMRDK